MRQKTCIGLMLMLLAGAIYGNSSRAGNSYYFSIYGSRDGLMAGTITGFHKDSKGFLWLLSENGLSRFDGYEFRNFRHIRKDSLSLPSSAIYASFSDQRGNSYFLTQNTLVRYTSEGFKRIITYSYFAQLRYVCRDSLVYLIYQNQIYIYNADKSTLQKVKMPALAKGERLHHFLLTDHGLFLFYTGIYWKMDLRSGQFKPFRIRRNGQSVILAENVFKPAFNYTDKNGVDWISACGVLLRLENGASDFEAYNPRPAENCEFRKSGGNLTKIDHYLYICGSEGKLYELDLWSGIESSVNLRAKLPPGLPDKVQYIGATAGIDESVWVQTNGGGTIKLTRGHISDDTPIYLNTINSNLPSNKCGLMMDFSPDILWIFASGTGLIKVEKLHSRITTIGNESIASAKSTDKNIRALIQVSDHEVMAATLDGVYLVDLNTGLFETLPDYSGQNYFAKGSYGNVAKDKQGNYWISSWAKNKIIFYNSQKKLTKAYEYPVVNVNQSSGIRSSAATANYIYFGNGQGRIYRVRNNTADATDGAAIEESGRNKSAELSTTDLIFSLMNYGEKSLLLGTSNGLFVLEEERDTVYRHHAGELYRSGLAEADIRDLIQTDDGRIWIATNGSGLFEWDQKENRVVNYDEKEGLKVSAIYTLAKEGNSKLWMGTSQGLIRFDIVKKTFTTFSEKDGILFKEFNTNAVATMNDGRFVFGGINGLVVFRPAEIQADSSSPKMLLNSILVNNKNMADTSYYRLRHDENSITFHFGALAFYRTEDIRYDYMLEGLDKDWIPSGNRRFTTYVNLDPGFYSFKVRSTNSHGIINPYVLQLNITITPPWYKTWIARSLFVLALITMIYGFYEYRARQHRKLQDIRDNIARDLHDEIGSNLSSISIFNEVARENLGTNPGTLPQVLDKISQYAQISQEAMNDIVWMIDSRNDRFENIILRMRNLAAETIGSSGIHLHLQIDESLNTLRLDMLKRKNFYLIYKEALNNLLKYSEATNAWVSLRRAEKEVLLNIKDDGKGFIPDANKGNGMINMKKRAMEIKADYKIETRQGVGTEISLAVPV